MYRANTETVFGNCFAGMGIPTGDPPGVVPAVDCDRDVAHPGLDEAAGEEHALAGGVAPVSIAELWKARTLDGDLPCIG